MKRKLTDKVTILWISAVVLLCGCGQAGFSKDVVMVVPSSIVSELESSQQEASQPELESSQQAASQTEMESLQQAASQPEVESTQETAQPETQQEETAQQQETQSPESTENLWEPRKRRKPSLQKKLQNPLLSQVLQLSQMPRS